MLQIIYILSWLLLSLVMGTNKDKIPFNISNPEIKIELSKELKEISGLTWLGNNQLGAIQDEAGLFFRLDANNGEIIEKVQFSLPGDFEGIEAVGGCIYTLTSSGTLFYFNPDTPEDVKRINTPLSWRNDAEGLGYDVQNNQLMIVCKELGSTNDSKFKGKSIFALDVTNHSFSSEPLAIIKKSKIEKFVKVDKFKPSGLAIDPLTQNIYIIASAGKLLIVLNPKLEVINAVKLPSKIYQQPEGICFSPSGDLYISNEGKDKRSNFYRLLRKK